MTDSSSFANALTEPLRQPFWWAALASISLHGTLGVSAPTISNLIYGGNSSKNRPGSVGFVELTPAEISRLPQTIPARPSNSGFSVAPVPLPPANLTPPLPPAPSTIDLPAEPPGMPPPGFFSPLPLPSPDLIAPLPPKTPSPTPKTPELKTPSVTLQQPPSNIIPPPKLSDFDDRNMPPPPPSPSSGEPPLFSPLNPGEEFDRDALQRRIAQSGLADEVSDANDIATPDDFRRGGRFASGADRPLTLTQKDPNKRDPFPQTPEEVARNEEFARRQRELQQGQSGSGTASRGEQIASVGERYLDLLKFFQSAYPDLKTTGPTPVNVPYPEAACAQKLEGIAVFGAVFKPEGTILALSPNAMLASTGYSILDDAAKQTLTERPPRFLPANTHRLYQLAIEFKYDPKICGAVPVTPSPTRTDTKSTPQPRQTPTDTKPANPQPFPAPTDGKPRFEKEPKSAPARQPTPAPSPAPEATPTPTPAPSPAPEATPTPAPSPAPEATPTPAPSPAPEATPTPAPSPAPEATPTPAPSPAPEATPTPAPSPAPEATPTPAPSPAGGEN